MKASLVQGKQLLELFSSATTEQVQGFIEAGDLVQQMCSADLRRVNRQAFAALLNPLAPLPEGLLTPTGRLMGRFMARSDARGWGFKVGDELVIGERLAAHKHAGPLQPVSISCWLGRDLAYNWSEALAWVLDTAREVGLEVDNYLTDARPEFYKGSEVKGRKCQIDVVGLDFQTFYDPANGIVPDRVRPQRERWPGLEVLYFLALNPGYLKAMDGDKLPWLMAPGLVVYGGGVPDFSRGGRRFFARYGWAHFRWDRTAMAALREL